MAQEDTDTDVIAYEPPAGAMERTNAYEFMQTFDIADYDELIERSVRDTGVEASGLEWFWDTLPDYLDIEFYEDYDTVRDDTDGPQFTDWYVGGELNIAHNVLDRHARPDAAARNRVALIWEGEPGEVRRVTYHDLHRQANRVANYLQARDVGVGDTVALYMPMVPEVVSILYGCFKVGAIAVPIFSGFGVDATATRLADAEPTVAFTGDGFYRRGEPIRLKSDLDAAIDRAGHVEATVVVDRLGADVPMGDRDEAWTAAIASRSPRFDTRALPSDATSMLLYSSGTTGEPKGIVHTHAGIQLQCAKEIYFNFDHKPGDRFFWVSDIGWMMGPWTLVGNHTFGGTVFMYEGAPDHPGPERYWEMIDRHGISVFGISPTAIRALRKYGDAPVAEHDLSTLRLLGSTGEPWDPESWEWFLDTVGGGDVPIINISGGTEICGCFLMPLPGQSLKPTSLGRPALGMDIDIVNAAGESVRDTGEKGYLVARASAPSMTKSLWSGDDRYLAEYWSTWEERDLWDHGDWAQRDADGFWFLHGRADDVLNVAGRKVGPAEVEGALMDHPAVNQAAAIGAPDDTTGTAVVAYVVLEAGHEADDALRATLREQVGRELGKPFRPREIHAVEEFPMTQSGKIVRRLIQSVHNGEPVGDLSSIENPEALDAIRQAA